MDGIRLGQLLDEHAAALTLYARPWCACPEDIVQEAFLKLASQAAEPAAVVPWLFRVVRNGAIDASRSEQRRRSHETQAAQQSAAWFEPRIDAKLDADVAVEALQRLPVELRETITLHLWGGLTFQEIASVMGSTPSSVHRWYQSGLQQLRERLSPCPSLPNPK